MRYAVTAIPLLATSLLLSSVAFARAEAVFGAFAFSQQKHFHTFSGPMDSREAAEDKALRDCRVQAEDCNVTNYFQNACGALSTAPDGSWGASWGDSEAAARQRSLGYCAEHSKECTVRAVQCVGNSGFAAPPVAGPQVN